MSSPRLCPAPPLGHLTSVVIRDTHQKMHPHQEGGPLHGTLNSPQPRKVPHVDHCTKGLILVTEPSHAFYHRSPTDDKP